MRERFARLVAVQDAQVVAYHRRKLGTTVRALIHGPSRKDPQVLSAKTLDNVTVNFPAAEDAPQVDEPWVDVRLERAAVWGLMGTAVARAARYAEPGRVLPPPLVDLVALR